jgi:cysteine-rich repeat protein
LLTLALVAAGCGDNEEARIDAASCTPVDDGNDCTEDICENDQPVNRNLDPGTTCSAGVCDGDGACVECVDSGDCTAPEVCDTDAHACIQPNCTDGDQNGDETDVDCGGTCAPGSRCADGLHCADGDDCESGVCTGTVCQAPSCGDGVRQGTEVCDDGNHANGDGCDDGTGGNCRVSGCGNGVVAGTEVCDDGNMTEGDGCDNNCRPTGCGNGRITGTEVCDDTNTTVGDGCSATCTVEAGYMCTGGSGPSVCTTRCGDGVVVGTEACDDPAPAENGDGCSMLCTLEPGYTCTGSPSVCSPTCGDGVRVGAEGCDDAPPAESGDGCNASCFVEPGWVCTGTPSTCFPICGDGQRVGTEPCDDPIPAENGDGCSAMCTVEVGYTCTGSPSSCTPICGDGLVRPGEACDDTAPAENGDGCSATCTVESGFHCSGSPSVCTTTCGDGIRAGAEACDDTAPAENGDGCSATCTVETGYACTGSAPSACAPICGDGMVVPGEPCDDGNAINTDGCSATCTVELGYNCQGSPSVCALTCGNGVLDVGEGCDDGGNAPNDGCSPACTIDTGWNCTGAPSSCATVCGDGAIAAGVEQCDDHDTDSGDGCSATCTVETGYTCTGATSTCVTTCGDGITAGTETCDDSCGAGVSGVCEPVDNNDGCSSTCQLECGNGVLNVNIEQCDDGNRIAGDRCSSTCTVEIACAAGDVPLVVNNHTALPIPDTNTAVLSPVSVPTAARVSKAVVFIGSLTHQFDDDVDMFLVGPTGVQREAATDIGEGGLNFRQTYFDDAAAAVIPDLAASAPFTGRFRPEQSFSTTVNTDFLGLRSAGTWNLRLVDDAGGDVGTLESWTLALCVTPAAAYCGDGIVNGTEECDDANTTATDACNNTCLIVDGCGDGNLDAGEVCDDDNIVSGDGCSSTCQLDITCAAGELPFIVSNTGAQSIPDNDVNGVNSPVTIPATGAVTKLAVFVNSITHTNDADIDMFLVSPNGVRRELSTDNGSTGDHFRATRFDDAAVLGITAGSAPFTGRFRGEQSLSISPTNDFRGLNAAGVWNLNVADDLATNTGTLDTWTLLVCVNPAAYCGDGITNGTDECDDGNTVNNDACSNTCAIADGCGDGNIDAGEVCDDNNIISGDGCSSTCTSDISCNPGETAVVLSSSTLVPIPDSVGSNNGGALGVINVPNLGQVRRVITTINVSHPISGDLDIFLNSPSGISRNLSDDNGASGANYTGTIFDDTAVNTIVGATAPFTGGFRPEETISNAAGFAGQAATGNWALRFVDDLATNTGSLTSWSLALCVDSAATPVCGNGFVEPGEQCDDTNAVAGDGCNACVLELNCAAGQSPVLLSATDLPQVIRDGNVPLAATSVINVPNSGTVRKVVVVIRSISHTFDGDVLLNLISPTGTNVDLSSGNGSSSDHFLSTIFDDGATTNITAGTPPYRGRFKPEAAMTGILGQASSGAWTLKAADNAAVLDGELNGWSIGLCVE